MNKIDRRVWIREWELTSCLPKELEGRDRDGGREEEIGHIYEPAGGEKKSMVGVAELN